MTAVVKEAILEARDQINDILESVWETPQVARIPLDLTGYGDEATFALIEHVVRETNARGGDRNIDRPDISEVRVTAKQYERIASEFREFIAPSVEAANEALANNPHVPRQGWSDKMLTTVEAVGLVEVDLDRQPVVIGRVPVVKISADEQELQESVHATIGRYLGLYR